MINLSPNGDRCYLGYDYAVWGKTRLCRLTIGLLVHSQCVGVIISSKCSAQMGFERAGDYSSSLRNNASSTIEGKGDIMTQAHPEGP